MDGLHGVSFADFNPHLPQEMTLVRFDRFTILAHISIHISRRR